MGGFTGYYTHIGDVGEHDLYEGEIPIERAGYVTDILSEQAFAWVGRRGPAPPGRPPGSKDTHRRAYTPRGAARGAIHDPDVPVTVPFPNPGQVQPPPDGGGVRRRQLPESV
jgi:hypothetical protein